MLTRLIESLCTILHIEKQVISGCGNVPLLTRWKLLVLPSFQLYLHRFNRSDEDRELHSHPFDFVSLILWNGYIEVRPVRTLRERLARGERMPLDQNPALYERRRYNPGSILIRRRWWAHRVELVSPTKCSWSLVARTPKNSEWGFFTALGWRHWTRWQSAKICDERIGTFDHETAERLYGLLAFSDWVASGRAGDDDAGALALTMTELRRLEPKTLASYGLTESDVCYLMSGRHHCADYGPFPSATLFRDRLNIVVEDASAARPDAVAPTAMA